MKTSYVHFGLKVWVRESDLTLMPTLRGVLVNIQKPMKDNKRLIG